MPKPNYCPNCGVFIMATTLTETPDKMPKPNYCPNCGVFIMATTLTETPDKMTCSHCWHVTYKNPIP